MRRSGSSVIAFALLAVLGIISLGAPAEAARAESPFPPAVASETTPLWVHFVDKGLASPAAERAAIERAAAALTPRARARRAKVRGANVTDFLDVPLHSPYVESVLETGAELRTRCRWLNAISVDATSMQRAAIEGLPGVEAVRRVAWGRRDPEEIVPLPAGDDSGAPRGGPDGRALNYGECSSQTLPIQVDQMHDLGYSGAGVLVTLMDTGFLLTHDCLVGVDVLAQWDFINDDPNPANEPGDNEGQHNHGTMVLSLIGGNDPGSLIGPAYAATYALAKTEDVTGETSIEEDYWIEAAQWADSLGSDIISTSLSYKDWYVYADMDGDTAPITIAADLAAANGIAVFASAGNQGTNDWFYIAAPADGDSVITVGAVDSVNVISPFSSHGPTADGRTKPDVCAMGVGTILCLPGDDQFYGRSSGTSFSCPITAGVGALLLEANPGWTPMQLREALRETATRSGTPDNDYGWGVIQAAAANGYATGAPAVAAGAAATSGASLAISPNPSASVTTIRWALPAGSDRGRLSIVDVSGRLVRDLGDVGGPGDAAANGSVAWTGRDDAGRRVASGIWFARLETRTGVSSARVIRIRQ